MSSLECPRRIWQLACVSLGTKDDSGPFAAVRCGQSTFCHSLLAALALDYRVVDLPLVLGDSYGERQYNRQLPEQQGMPDQVRSLASSGRVQEK